MLNEEKYYVIKRSPHIKPSLIIVRPVLSSEGELKAWMTQGGIHLFAQGDYEAYELDLNQLIRMEVK